MVFNGVSAAWATSGKNSTFDSKSASVAADVGVAAGDVSPCTAVEASWDAAVCALAAADVPFVVCGAGVNGVSVVADADVPA